VRERRSARLLVVAVTVLVCGGLACVGENPLGGSNSSPEAGPSPAADTGLPDAGVESEAPPPACPDRGARFTDDFEGRSDLLGCWSRYTAPNRFDASAAIAALDQNRAFRIQITGDGSQGAPVASHLTRSLAIRMPARVTWRFRVDLPNLGGAKNGFIALTLTYAGSSGPERVSVPMIIGAPNDQQLSAFLGAASTPQVVDLASSAWHTARLTAGDDLALEVDGRPCTTLPLELSLPRDIVEIDLGVKANTIAGTYDVSYDDVTIESLR
jgi:hypothetical protein